MTHTPAKHALHSFTASLALLGAGILLPALSSAAEVMKAQPKAYTMTVSGTSTLHDWESKITELTTAGSVEISDAEAPQHDDFVVEIPVRSIVSPHDRMDRLTYEALEAKNAPTIRFELQELTAQENGKLLSKGALTIAGQTQPVAMEVDTKRTESGELVVSGSVPLKMTDFGIKPPSLMLGAIKVGDEVEIDFELTLN